MASNNDIDMVLLWSDLIDLLQVKGVLILELIFVRYRSLPRDSSQSFDIHRESVNTLDISLRLITIFHNIELRVLLS